MKIKKTNKIVPTTFVFLVSVAIIYLLFYGALYTNINHSSTTTNQEEHRQLVDYLLGPLWADNPLTWLEDQERSHMSDVKFLLDISFIIMLFCLGILIGIGITLPLVGMKRHLDELLGRALWLSGWGILAICIFIGLASILSFNKLWTLMHFILFPQGNWMFSANSTLIQMYPLEFFQVIVLKLSIYTIVGGIILIFLGLMIKTLRWHDSFFHEFSSKAKYKSPKHSKRRRKQ